MKQAIYPLAKKSIAVLISITLIASLFTAGGLLSYPHAYAEEDTGTHTSQTQGEGASAGGATDGSGTGGVAGSNSTPGTGAGSGALGGDSLDDVKGEGEQGSNEGSVSNNEGNTSTTEPSADELIALSAEAGEEGITVLAASSGGSSLIGRGTSDDPLQIHTSQQLKDFAECFNTGTLPESLPKGADLHLALMNDIDISAYPNWEPIGTYNETTNNPFMGTFKSAASGTYTIRGLSIDAAVDASSTNTAFGVFGYTNGATLERIRVEASQVNVTASADTRQVYTGTLIGVSDNGEIIACSASGSVKIEGGRGACAGGLIGSSSAKIHSSYATGSVQVSNALRNDAGGLVGISTYTYYSYATGSVVASGGGSNYAGGLVGSGTEVSNSYATGSVKASGGSVSNYTGGLIGMCAIEIVHSYATGSATASGGAFTFAGGLAGDSKDIECAYATGNITASGAGSMNLAGGLAGNSSRFIKNSYAIGSVSASGGRETYAGGLAGRSISLEENSIKNAIALGQKVSASGGWTNNFGGRIVGSIPNPTITNNYAWDGMLVNGVTKDGAADIDGTSATYAMLTGTSSTDNLWTDTLKDFADKPWTYDTSREQDPYAIPVLTGLPEPAPQNNNLPFWVRDAASNPTEFYIYTAQDLAAFRDTVNAGNDFTDKTVYLMNNIDISEYTFWEPIGVTAERPFKGTFTSYSLDPDNPTAYIISGLSIHETVIVETANAAFGLFGFVHGAAIKHIRVEAAHLFVDSDVENVDCGVGILAGYVEENATVESCFVQGTITAAGKNSYVGGLIGDSRSPIKDSSASVSVTVSGGDNNYAGGLVGTSTADIFNSYATGAIVASGGNNNYAGGIAGNSSGDVSNSFASVEVQATNGSVENYAGGLVASSTGSISNTYATGSATAVGGTTCFAGGLVGSASADISNSYATGSAVAKGGSKSNAGGLVGIASGSLSNTYATGSATASGGSMNNHAGGLAGGARSISNSYATGSASASGGSDCAGAGGIAGYISESINNSYATGSVTAVNGGENYAGGIVGYVSSLLRAFALVENSIALGREVVSSGDTAGRIAGSSANLTLANNYAWDGMKVKGNVVSDQDSNAKVDGIHGAHATYAMLTGTDTATTPNLWTGALSVFTVSLWTYDTDAREHDPYALPVLSEVVNASLQNNNLPFWVRDAAGNPTEFYIYTAQDLAAFRDMVNAGNDFTEKTVYLMNNIDISGYPNWEPIGILNGTSTPKLFSGIFISYSEDQNNPPSFVISGLSIDETIIDGYLNKYFGLFGYVNGATIKNIRVEDAQVSVSTRISTLDYSAGILIGGVEWNATIENCSVQGTVTASGGNNLFAGGLVGDSRSPIQNSSASVSVTAAGGAYNYAGGIVGASTRDISNSHATGSVEALYGSNNYAGGITGYSSGAVSNSFATVDVQSTEDSEENYAGGLIGVTSGVVENSYATGSARASEGANNYAGGLAASSANTIKNSYATGSARAFGDDANNYAGGLVGLSSTAISSSYATGSAVASGSDKDNFAGGLVGKSDADVSYSYATGSATASGGAKNNAGGLIGYAKSIVSSYATGSVSAADGSACSAGGVAGYSESSIINSYATGSVSALDSSSSSNAGGLAGQSAGSVENSYATGSVKATGLTDSNTSGGLVGTSSGAIKNSVALGQKVSASPSQPNYTGRIVGNTAAGSLSNNYAWNGMTINGSVIAEADENAKHDKMHGAHLNSNKALDAFWWAKKSSEGGPAFDYSDATGAWDATDGFLPLLKSPKATAYRPLWLITLPPDTPTISLEPDTYTFPQKEGKKETIKLTATGTYQQASPSTLSWTSDDAIGAVNFTNTSNVGATIAIDLSTVGTYTISAALAEWPELAKDTVTIYVTGGLGEVGTATLSGESTFGDTLTAGFTVTEGTVPAPEGIIYTWYVGETKIKSGEEKTLTLDNELWIGQTVQVHVSASNYAEEAVSAGKEVTKLPYSGEVIDPVLEELGPTALELVECTGYEYQIVPAGTPVSGLTENGWQDSPLFTQLTCNEKYDLYQRVKETSTTKASDPKGLLGVLTTLEYFWQNGQASYTKQSNVIFGLTLDYDHALLDGVFVDNNPVTDISTASGSTIITFHNAYLDGLATGTHTLRVTYTDGAFIETTFEVKAAVPSGNGSSSKDNLGGARTGDTVLPTLALIAALGTLGAAGIYTARRIKGRSTR